MRLARWLAARIRGVASFCRSLRATRRARLAATLGVLSAALLATAVLGGEYIVSAAPGLGLPALPQLRRNPSTAAPRYLFSIGGISQPLGVAVSPGDERIYVTESGGERATRILGRDGTPVGFLAPPDSTPQARAPVYVAVDPRGRVYVSDRRSASVHVYAPDGEYLNELLPPVPGEAWAPMGLAFDSQGSLLVTEVTPGRHGVVVYGPDGEPTLRFGREGTGVGEFSYPNAVARDRRGSLLVADSNNGRVVVLAPNGAPPRSFGRGAGPGALGLPRGLAVDARDRVFVADALNHAIFVFELGEAEPRLLLTFGGQGQRERQLSFPNGLALGSDGRLYVADRENNRVQVWGS